MTRGHLELRVNCPDGFTPDTRLVRLGADGGPEHAAALRGALEALLKELRRDKPRWVVFDLSAMVDDEPVRGLIRHFVPPRGSGRRVLLAGASAAFSREMHSRRTGQAEVEVFESAADALVWLRRTYPESCGGEAVVAVTAAMVSNLRRRTGAGIMTCRDALQLFNGDEDIAAEWIGQHGLAVTTRAGGLGHAIPLPDLGPSVVGSTKSGTEAGYRDHEERERGITINNARPVEVEKKLAVYEEARRQALPSAPAAWPTVLHSSAPARPMSPPPPPPPPPPADRISSDVFASAPMNQPSPAPATTVSTAMPMPEPEPVEPSPSMPPPLVEPAVMMEVAAAPKSARRGMSISLPSIPMPSLPSFGRGKEKKRKSKSRASVAPAEKADMAPPRPKPAPPAEREEGDLLKAKGISGEDDPFGVADPNVMPDIDIDTLTVTGGDSGMELVEIIKRMATVRYFSQMNPGKVFPLSVRFTKEKLQEWHTRAVSQVTGDEAIAVRADDPFLTVRPNFPGCHVSPAEQVVDLSAEESGATFSVSPYAAGWMKDAAVEMVYHDAIVQTIQTPFRITTQKLSRAAAALSFLSPAYMMGLQAAGLDPTSQAKQGFPLLANMANGVGGLTNLGLLCGAVMLTAAGIFYWMMKPKKSDPLYIFYNGPGG